MFNNSKLGSPLITFAENKATKLLNSFIVRTPIWNNKRRPKHSMDIITFCKCTIDGQSSMHVKMRSTKINMQISVELLKWEYWIDRSVWCACEQFMNFISALNENLWNESTEKVHLDEIKKQRMSSKCP